MTEVLAENKQVSDPLQGWTSRQNSFPFKRTMLYENALGKAIGHLVRRSRKTPSKF